jgi:hypothetical protein
MAVIHLHGIPDKPSSIVLPGSTMIDLHGNEAFRRFVSAVMAPRIVLYLGFSLRQSEAHLRDIVSWLGSNAEDAGHQYLLLDEAQIRDREEDMDLFSTYGNLTVVGYAADREHTAVERVALALAPREDDELAWVVPPLLREEDTEDEDAIRHRISSFEFNMAGTTMAEPPDLLAAAPSLVIGGPGLGKSRLLHELPGYEQGRTTALGVLRDFAAMSPPARAIAHLLADLSLETLEAGGTVLRLDGLDEVPEGREDDAIRALVAAIKEWPDHAWVISSRPGLRAQVLSERLAGLTRFRIFASRRWARVYLRTRAVPPDRVDRALRDGYGLGDLIAIPLFAKRLADHLLSDDHDQVSPLELLVDEQYRSAEQEALRHGLKTGTLGDWLAAVAIALELRGLAAAPSEDLAELPGEDQLGAADARAQLIDATLLADVPGSTAFPAKTLQEGLVADAMLRSKDVLATIDAVASADVAGQRRLRDDMEMTLDLVFEDADRDTREALRSLDSLRWARTVATRGDEQDAHEAFKLIWTWHAERDRAFPLIEQSVGLRSTRQAVAEIARRWPQVIEDWRDQLQLALGDSTDANRLRALMVLSRLPEDDHTADWLEPLLRDTAPRVLELAADTVRRLRLSGFTSQLRDLLAPAKEATSGLLHCARWPRPNHSKSCRPWSLSCQFTATFARSPSD